jgi:hypothetical protein
MHADMPTYCHSNALANPAGKTQAFTGFGPLDRAQPRHNQASPEQLSGRPA